MNKFENLKDLLNTVHRATRKLLDDITEEEALFQINDNFNHITWLTGHILYSAQLILDILGEKKKLPEEWVSMFRGGHELLADSSKYPSIKDLLDRLDEFYDRIDKAVDGKSDGFLDEKVEIVPDWIECRLNALQFFCAHEFYHAGQIAMIRKSLGRERSFG